MKEKKILLVARSFWEHGLLTEMCRQLNRWLKIDLAWNYSTVLKTLLSGPESEPVQAMIIRHEPPEVSALQLLNQLNLVGAAGKIKKYVLADLNDEHLCNLCLQAGAIHCFEKPQRPSELKSM